MAGELVTPGPNILNSRLQFPPELEMKVHEVFTITERAHLGSTRAFSWLKVPNTY